MTKDEVVDFVQQCGVEFALGRDKDEPSVRFYGATRKDLSLNFHCRGPADHLRADFVFTGRDTQDSNVEDANAFMRLYGGKRGRLYDADFTVFVRMEPLVADAPWLRRVIQAYWASSARFA